MNYISEFPHKLEEIENEFITMSDDVKLAARLWIPESAWSDPVPTIFEYIPYRKRDYKRLRDERNHRYFAGHGYACIRADMRGSGDSEGVLKDEYLERELLDGEQVIQWLREQPWCNGRVGMIGISWGGFNGLQLAARRPPGLDAIITIASTDDRYADDVHYMGGCLLGDNLSWATVMFNRNSLPPDPEIVGDKWKEMWLQRLEHSGLWIEKWLEHQKRDEYWKHGSVCENYADIECAVMAVSGWADGYTNAVFRMMEHLNCPRMGLVGPWSHKYPHFGEPGPAIGFLQKAVRWWDRWLKDRDTGIDKEPQIKAWVQESVPPFTRYKERPGYWLGLESWPSPIIQNKTYTLSAGRLNEQAPHEEPEELTVKSPLRLGLFAGKWCSYNAPPDLPSDQREEDGGALVFDTAPLPQDMEVIGAPKAQFVVRVDEPVAMIAVRLSDIGLDGKATRVTYGILNLTHFKSHEFPEPLKPNTDYTVRVKLNEMAHRFPKGHKIRVAVSTSYWPLAWPSPKLVTLSLFTQKSTISLPVKMESGMEDIQFEAPECAESTSEEQIIHAPNFRWQVIRDLIKDQSTLHVVIDRGSVVFQDIDLNVKRYTEENYTVQNDDLSTLKGETIGKMAHSRENWHTETKTHTILTSDEEYFYIHATLDAFEGRERIFSKNWQRKIKRELV